MKCFLWPRIIPLPFLNLDVYLPGGREQCHIFQEVLSHSFLTAGPLPFTPSVNEKKPEASGEQTPENTLVTSDYLLSHKHLTARTAR